MRWGERVSGSGSPGMSWGASGLVWGFCRVWAVFMRILSGVWFCFVFAYFILTSTQWHFPHVQSCNSKHNTQK